MSTPNEQIEEIIQSALMGSKKPAEEATREIFEDYILIRRADLPDANITERDGETHVDCGSDWGTWNVKHVARMRETSLEYVAAYVAADAWNSKQAVLARKRNKRRDELAAELFGGSTYADLGFGAPEAINRIIDLESAA